MLLLTCEHGGNDIPPRWGGRFQRAKALLEGHRGYDLGARDLAEHLAARFSAPLVLATVSRLLVDLNRSPRHRALFSRYTQDLEPDEKEQVLAEHYLPHRRRVEALIDEALRAGAPAVVHVAIHSFTPVLDGRVREVDLGLLYDPGRSLEVRGARAWRRAASSTAPSLRLRCNRPYRGVSDGLTRALRVRFPDPDYAGFELEMNQGLLTEGRFGAAAVAAAERTVEILLATASKPAVSGSNPLPSRSDGV